MKVLNIECQKYLKNHLNEGMLIEFLNFLSLLNINQLNEFHKLTDLYIFRNGYKYIYNNDIFNELSIKSNYNMLHSEKLIANEENDILKRIMKYNALLLKNENSVIDNMNKLYESINWNEIELKRLEEDEKRMLERSNINILNYLSNNINNRVYISIYIYYNIIIDNT